MLVVLLADSLPYLNNILDNFRRMGRVDSAPWGEVKSRAGIVLVPRLGRGGPAGWGGLEIQVKHKHITYYPEQNLVPDVQLNE